MLIPAFSNSFTGPVIKLVIATSTGKVAAAARVNRTEFRCEAAVRGEQNRVPLGLGRPGTEASSVENRPPGTEPNSV